MTPKQVADFLRKQADRIEEFPGELEASIEMSRPVRQLPSSSLVDELQIKFTGDYYATLKAQGEGLEVECHFHDSKRV